MPKENEIRIILETMCASKYNYIDPRVKKRNIDQAISSLKSVVLECVPEKIEHEQDCQYGETEVCTCLSAYYYNQAITKTKSKIEEMFK